MNQIDQRISMQLSCPMPKWDFDVITLGHGSGGLLTNRLIEKCIMELLGNEVLNKRHDGAILDLTGPLAFSTDSFVISPIFFPGGNIGELAVNGTVNDLAMCGALPRYLSLGFIIEEGLTMREFWDVLVSVKFACELAGVQVVTGDTKVVEKGKGDKLFVNTSGVGVMHSNAAIGAQNVQEGDQIIVSDRIATHGIAVLSERESLEFEPTLESDTRALNHTIKSLLDQFGNHVHLLRDPTRGGVGTVLSEIARDTQLGILVHEKSLPIDPQVASVCELLGLDPLYVANEGIFIAFVDSSVGQEVLTHLSQVDGCHNASIIGEITGDHNGQAVLQSGIGGRRALNMLVGEQLPRIC